MKKLLTAFFALILSITCAFGLAACVDKGGNGGNTNNPGTTTTKSDAEIAKTAINNLKTLYNKESEKEHGSSYEVLGKTQVDGKLYEIVWTVSSESTEYDIHEYVTVGEDIDPETLKVTIGVKRASVKLEYILTATVTVNDAVESFDFERTVPASAIGGDKETVSAGIQFDVADKLTEISKNIQVWEQNGIKVTGLKGSGSDVASNANPTRFYKGAIVKIEYPGMKYLSFVSPHYTSGDSPTDYATPIKTSLENAHIPATITVEHGDESELKHTVTVELDYPMDYIEIVASAQLRIYTLDIEAIVGGATDADKVAVAKAAISIGQTTFAELGTLELPTSSYGTTLTWSVKETTDLVSITDNTLTIAKLPTVDTDLTLVAAIVCGNEDDTAEVSIKVLKDLGLTNDGSREHPFTTAEAKTLAATLDANSYYQKDGSPVKVYVKGYVVAVSGFNSTFNNWTGVYIAGSADGTKDDTDAMQAYRFAIDGTVIKAEADLVVGSSIVVCGYLQHYKASETSASNYQLTYNGNDNPVAVEYQKAEEIEPEPGEHVHNWVSTNHNEGTWTHTAHCSADGCTYEEGAKTDDCTPVLNECSACGHTYSENDILTALFALEKDTSLKGTYQLRGKVTQIVDAYNPTYSNVTFDMQVGDKVVRAFRVKGTGADTIGVGDTVTVSGVLKNYNNTCEFDANSAVSNIVEASPADKVANALAAVPEKLNNVILTGDVTLPTSTIAGVTFTWVSDNETYKVEDGKLVVNELPTGADVTVTLTVTANCTGVTSNNTKTVTVVIKKAAGGDEKSYFVKVTSTSDLVSDASYLIVYETDNYIFDGSLAKLDAEANRQTVTISESKIEVTATLLTYTFTISEVTGGYSIKSASGYYIGQSSDSNIITTNQTTVQLNTITFETNGDVNIIGAGNGRLRYNSTESSGNRRFRYYKAASYANQKAIQLYKLVEA